MDSAAIQLSDLTKFYGAHRGIEDVDLSVQRGEVFGFLGPNGAGKTTTIRILLDLLRATSGQAKVLGLDCRRDSLRVRRQIGYLPSEYHLYENLTGAEALDFLGNVGGTVDPAYTRHLANHLGADLTRTIRTLSHGNKQKLAIVLAFLQKAPLLILDEPTTGLDPLVQQEFFTLVEQARDDGRTVFLSSHNLTEVERVCDRVAIIQEGKLVAVEEVAAIRKDSLRLVEMTCVRPLDEATFADLAGLDQLRIDGTILRCSIRGSLGELIARAIPYEIADVLSREPSLEEFFLARYGERRSERAR